MEFDLSRIKLSNYDVKRGLVLPRKPSKELAEFIGILAGDGYVSFNNYDKKNIISVSGNQDKDMVYFKEHVIPLIKGLFNLNAQIYNKKSRRTSEIYFSSKNLVSFLRIMGYYKRKREIKIPKWILKNGDYLRFFIKGLADTDFCLIIREKGYPVIELTSIHNLLIDILDSWLSKNGFTVYCKYDNKRFDKRSNKIRYESLIRLSGHINLVNWMKRVGFRNPRQLIKYVEYKKKNGAAGI